LSDPALAVPITLALGPGLIALAAMSRKSLDLWINALLGGAGWFVALLTRLPLLMLARGLEIYARALYASLMAGLFEETARYFVVKSRSRLINNLRSSASIGLGWGLTEALIIYALQVPFVAAIINHDWTAFIPGALERNIAIAFHLAMTLLISLTVIGRPLTVLLPTTASLHFLLNAMATFIATRTEDPWIIEGSLALIVLAIVIPVYAYTRRLLPPMSSQKSISKASSDNIKVEVKRV
jgi:uncharacterized membrane protein YhfC